jgi:hypothetical protein
MCPYDFYGSGATFTGGTTSGTANSYNATDHVTHFLLNNNSYTTLSQWLTVVSPQDSAATTTRSGASTCTLPTIPDSELVRSGTQEGGTWRFRRWPTFIMLKEDRTDQLGFG